MALSTMLKLAALDAPPSNVRPDVPVKIGTGASMRVPA